MRFKDKVAIVTGGGSGIGQAAAVLFAKEGASVAVADYHADRARMVANDICADGGKAIALAVDVADAIKVERMVKQVMDTFKGIDILLNGAGKLLTYKVL